MANLPIFADITLILRGLLLMVAGYNLAWSVPWLWKLIRSRGWPLSLIKGGICLTALGITILQLIILSALDGGADSAMAAAAFASLLAGQFCLAVSHHTGWAERLMQLDAMAHAVENMMRDSDEKTATLDDRTVTLLSAHIGEALSEVKRD